MVVVIVVVVDKRVSKMSRLDTSFSAVSKFDDGINITDKQ
tara:strand:+ start:914 stop:1033 length:120 start_codon:yes stop_codon:yes gene_type:complete